MAINSLDSSCDKLICKSDASSTSSKARAGDLPSCRLLKINFATESAVSKRGRKKNSNSNSPYLNDDSFHLLSQVTEKTIFRKKDTMFFSSFPLAANIYKANSDECESLKKTTKKAKKSVLTLPNYQADPVHQICTDGDINYSEDDNQDKVRQKIKRRNPVPRNQKSRPEGRYYELYDRNAGHGFPMELVDCSSIETIQDYASKRRKAKPKSVVGSKQKAEQKPNPHDVWSLLRNLNRFQFSQSPSTSTDSDVFPTMGTTTKRRNNRKDKLVAETCRTEQFAYSSSFEVDGSFSRSSSFDRITVINKQSEFSKICKNFEKRIAKTKSFVRNANNKLQNRNQNSKAVTNTTNTLKANTKSITHKLNNSRALPLEYNSNKQRYNNCGEGDTKKNAVKRNSDSPAFDCTQTEFQNPLYNETNDSQFSTEIVETNNNQELIYTDSTGFSKGAAKKEIISKGVPDRTVLSTVSSSEDHNTFKGIIKVVLSKGSTIPPPKRNEFPTRKRQPSIVPSHSAASKYISSTVSPKLTQTDIKRRLALLKFPIVVLGKDQLSSTHEVLNLEPTQFNGLNERVWPFMEQWQNGDSYKLENKLKKKNDNSNKKITREILELNKSQKIHRGLTSSKQLNEYRKNTDNAKNYNKGKMEKKRITLPAELQQHAQTKNIKPILQFKEKILKLLYKKSSIPNFVAENNKINEYSDVKTKPAYKTTCKKLDTSTDTHLKNGGYSDVKTKPAHKITSSKVDTSTQMDTIGGYSKVKTKSATKVTGNKADTRTDTHLMSSRNDISGNPINSPVTVKDTKKMRCTKEPCAKARWASDFIDNVIRKIKNGVYYNHDSKLPNQKHGFEYKEAEIETVATNNKNQDDQQISKIGTNKTESVTIPGFDDNILPALEIQTMNTSEISVKHCVTNIMVHFNVAMPNDPVINTNRSSLISLDKTEGQTKIFNCKTFLINAMLPAELCSILPKMMCNIIKETETLELAPVPVLKYPSHLSIIAEVINTEMPEPFKLPLFGHLRMTPELQKLITGVYPNKPRPKLDKTYYAKYDRCLSEKLLPRLSRSYLFDFVAQPTSTLENYFPKWTFLAPAPVKDITCRNQLNTCMALQPYPASNRRLVPALNKQLDLAGFLRRMSSYIASCSRVFNYFFDNNITVNLTTTNTQGLEDRFSIMVSSLMKNDNENASEKLVSDIFTIVNNKHLPAIQCIELKSPSSKLLQKRAPANNKTKKKSFINLYRKFKSTSNIFGGRTSTSLSQITNTDEFLQALGTPKLFAEIFDSTYGLRILSSLKEMTCWITDITPTQALLVLLLVNKKDTSSLVRFRPVLLQGIAVNRITRASELDMEIEVIEREQLNGLSQPEGISYLPASAENRDNLLEELYWIAKTTASDYQRTFDESSEKLLKSLLEKRKKLNPSYLRVMARYVGLGLLKPPIKK